MSTEIIDPLSSSNDGSSYYSESATLGKEDFLELLIAQLQYQDPLNPMDNQNFIAELAQFSSLEQLQNVNSNLEMNMLLSQSLNNSSATNLIGKRLLALGNQVYLPGDDGEEITFELAANAGVTVEIYDADGDLVRTLKGGYLSAGRNRIRWDGQDQEGNQLPSGNYTHEITATDSDGNSVDVTTYSSGLIRGVRFQEGNAVLMLGNQEINLSEIIEIFTP